MESKKKILIIDDEQLILKTTALLLKCEGYIPLCASDGKQGLAVTLKEKPDMILLDIMMPGMDGWEVLSNLRSKKYNVNTPVVIFTAVDFVASEKMAKEKGQKQFFESPFKLHQLKTVIGACL